MATSAPQLPWLPLAKAAEKVSELTGKHHSEADILRAALAGHLTLSVQLISPVFARPGHFQKYAKDAPHGISANVSLLCAGNGVGREKSVLPEFLGIGDVAFAYSSDEGEYVQGLLDLLLIRNGKAHVQNLERRLQGECGGYFLPSGGIYLKGPTGIFWELQEEVHGGNQLDDHEIEWTPSERFREDWRIVVRPSELEGLLSFHEKPLAPTPPVDAPPTTAPPAAEHQAADQQPALRRGEKVYRGQNEITEAYNRLAKTNIKWPGVRKKRQEGLTIEYKMNGRKEVPTLDHIDLLDFLDHLPR